MRAPTFSFIGLHLQVFRRASQRGFTLLELLVAITVFVLVAVMAIGSFIILLSAQKKAVFVQTNQDNVRFAIEALSREIRLGGDYRQAVGGYCNDPGAGVGTVSECFEFKNSSEQNVVIKRSTNPAECKRPGVDGCIVRCVTNAGGICPPLPGATSDFQPLTAPEVNIQALTFLVAGNAVLPLTDTDQSRVSIIMKGVTPGTDPRQSQLILQTTISRLGRDN